MKREDRLSAGMTPEKVSQVYAILKARFESRRKKLRELEAHGVICLVTTQCLYERADFSVYEVGRNILSEHVFSGRDMTTEAAVTKMMWALSLDNPAQVLSENLCGEFR